MTSDSHLNQTAPLPQRGEEHDATAQERGEPPPTRDRDQAGRARNARPRDALGRPLPRGADGVPTVPDDLELDPDSALTMAQDLLDRGMPFQAHEVLEAMWKQCPDAERDLWQGLAQIAVGITHVLRGNSSGGARLLRRGVRRLEPYAGTEPHRIEVDGVRTTMSAAAAAVEADRDSSEAAEADTSHASIHAGRTPDLSLRLRATP